MRSSVASRNRIGPTQHRPIGCGKGFEARRQSACYHTSAGSSACRRKTGQGTGLGERFHGAKSGSHSALRWREMDSNFRYRGRRPASGRSLRAQRVETDAAKREFGSGSCLFAPPWGGSGGLGGSLCFPFPTPGNGQQESRLAPIGRHLRLLRRGVLRTGCFPRQAAFQGGHEIDDGWRGRDLPGFNGDPLHLGFD